MNLTTLLLEEAALSNTTVAILQLLSETAVFCISRIANFDFSQQVLKSSALWQSIVGWESSRKSSGCLPEPRGSRCPSFSNSLSLSLSLSLDFSSIWEKYAKAHHSLNSHISSSYIQPKVRGEENWTNWPKFPGTTDLPQGFRFEALFAEHNHPILKLEDE